MISRPVQQTHEVGVNAAEHWETSCVFRIKSITKTKMRTAIGHGETRCETLPEWLADFKDNLVDEEVSAPRGASPSSSHEPLHPEPPPKVISGTV